MKYIFVGDVHGKVDAVEEALSKEGMKIFMGDFIDSFDRNAKDHDECYRLVCDAIEAGTARSVFGNHELSYLKKYDFHRCSGYDYQRQHVVNKYKDRILGLFESHIFLSNDILVSHAGLTKQIWDDRKLDLTILDEWLTDGWAAGRKHPVHWIGYSRGGRDQVGGIFWNDWNMEFEPIPGLVQIMGHSRGRGIRQKDQSFCIDCLDDAGKDHKYTFLEMEFDDNINI